MANEKICDGKCPLCGHPVEVKKSSKGWPYVNCPPPADGGCGCQVFARSAKSGDLLSKAKAPAAPKPAVTAAAPKPAAPVSPARKRSFLDVEL